MHLKENGRPSQWGRMTDFFPLWFLPWFSWIFLLLTFPFYFLVGGAGLIKDFVGQVRRFNKEVREFQRKKREEKSIAE